MHSVVDISDAIAKSQQLQLLPMLVKTLTEKETKKNNFSFNNYYYQIKYDGHRAFYIVDDKEIRLVSKIGKKSNLQSPILEKGIDVIRKLLKDKLNVNKFIIDGEFFNPEIDFNMLSSIIRKKEHTIADYEKIKIKIFDIVLIGDKNQIEEPFETRKSILKLIGRIIKKYKIVNMSVVKLLNVKFKTLKELYEFTKSKFEKNKVEGIILRDKRAKYMFGKRNDAIYKYKIYEEDEYPIIAYTFGKKNDLVIWVCELPNGEKFKVQQAGTGSHKLRLEISKKLKANPTLFNEVYRGKLLKVIYYDKTTTGKPKFAKGTIIKMDNEIENNE